VKGRVLGYGAEAVLIEVAGLPEAMALDAALRRLVATDPAWAGVTDVVPAARTVLVVADPAVIPGLTRAAAGVLRRTTATTLPAPTRTVVIPVSYDGPDLADVAALTGLDVAEVVTAHTGTPWRVGFTGFAPGFAYLIGGDPRLRVPRRATPRAAVAAGSVALAATYSAVYPLPSPGGWQVIGHTAVALWDAGSTAPALLTPGTEVRFEVAP